MRKRINNQGSALIITMVLFTVLSLSIMLGLVVPVLHASRIAEDSLQSKQSYFSAESGVEDALYRLRNGLPLSSSETLVFGKIHTTTEIETVGSGRMITSLGDARSRHRSVSLVVTQGAGVSFPYGLEAGTGGIHLDSGSVIGSVHANGPITASTSGSNSITGNATSTTAQAPLADQENDGGATPGLEVRFGGSIDWQTNYSDDVAQSIGVSATNTLSSIRLYIKKSSSASRNNITVRIAANNNGAPGTTLASAVVDDMDVGVSYGYVTVPFTAGPTLTAGSTYWIVLDTAATYGSYYTLGATTNTYAAGTLRQGVFGGSFGGTTPANLDGYFGVFLGGTTGSIRGVKGSGIGGDARAYSVENSLVQGTLYCQSGVSNNKTCTNGGVVSVKERPVSDDAFTLWEEKVLTGAVTSGNVTIGGGQTVSMGPRKILGNLTVTGGATVILDGTLWVTGTLTINGGATVRLSSAYGANSDAVLVNGAISISGGGKANGSGSQGSYILLISRSASTSAIVQDGGSGSVILVAQDGTVTLQGGVTAKQVTGNRIVISGGSSVVYDSGISSLSFSNAVSSSWKINSWKEI